MSTVLRIRPKYQITIPEELRGSVKVGDFLDIVVVKDGILLRPVAVVQLASKGGATRKRLRQ